MNVHEPNTGAPTSTEHDQTGALLQDIADSSTAPASSSNKEADEGAKLPCSFFLRTGTCAYGERCKFFHPLDRPEVLYNSRGLPLRPNEPECSFYVRNGWCAFADTCKFHHPELPGPAPPAASGAAQQQQQRQQQQQQQPQQRPQQQQQHDQQISPQQQQGTSGVSDHKASNRRGTKVSSHAPAHHQQPHQGYVMQPFGVPSLLPGPYPALYGPVPPSPGQPHMMMPMGYYPTLPPGARLYPMMTSPMLHPVMHMRPVVSMAMAGPGLPVAAAQQAPPHHTLSGGGSSSNGEGRGAGGSAVRNGAFRYKKQGSNQGTSSSGSSSRGGKGHVGVVPNGSSTAGPSRPFPGLSAAAAAAPAGDEGSGGD